tara:strand:+ start:842 stop:1114 length:273 start_codon:yes stop_codon:yes gene_type:complete
MAKAKSQKSLDKWTGQEWEYAGKEKKSVYLPKKKIERLKSTGSGRTKLASASKKKRQATKKGEQHSRHGLASGTGGVDETLMKNMRMKSG